MAVPYEDLINTAYAAFNTMDIDTALTMMHPDIDWPKAFEGGYVSGHEAIRDYWTRQWSEIDPNVTPARLEQRPDGSQGALLFDGIVKHIYTLQDGLLRRMDIETE